MQTSYSNPVLFSFWIEIRIERTIERVCKVAVASRKDLNNIRTLHRIVSCINKRRIVTVHLLEEEIFVFGLGNRVRREVHTGVTAIGTIGAIVNNASVRTEGVVNHTAAFCAIGSNQVVGKCLPAIVEECVILERAVVRIVRTTGITNPNVGTPSHAVEFAAVSISTYGARHVSTVAVIRAADPVAVDFSAFGSTVTRCIFAFALFFGVLRIALARRTVMSVRFRCMETVTCQIRMLLQESAGVHHANGNTLTAIAQCIRRRSIHCSQTPISFVFIGFPGLFRLFKLCAVLSYKTRFNISSRSSRCAESCGNSNSYNSALGGLAVRLLCFVRNDKATANIVPQCLESLIHK